MGSIFYHTRNEIPTQETTIKITRKLLKSELAFWSKFAGAQAAQVLPLCASLTAVYLFFFVIGGVLTRLD